MSNKMTDKIIIIKDGETHEVDISRIKLSVSEDKKVVSISDNRSGVDFPLKRNGDKKTYKCSATCSVEVDLEAEASNMDEARTALMEKFAQYDIGQCVRKNIGFSSIMEIL